MRGYEEDPQDQPIRWPICIICNRPIDDRILIRYESETAHEGCVTASISKNANSLAKTFLLMGLEAFEEDTFEVIAEEELYEY